MISNVFNTVFYQPLYNGLIFLINLLPWFDVGVVVVIFTIVVKLILLPLSHKAAKTQVVMREIEPKLNEVKEKHKDDSQQQALAVMNLYREQGINPFSGFLLILIQLPIIFALYYIFLRSGLPEISTDLIYSFINIPTKINMEFLGLIDISGKSYVLAFLAAVTTFFQMRLSIPKTTPKKPGDKPSFKDDLTRSMSVQMRYIFPVIVFFISFNISGAVALYWFTSNAFTIGQEIMVKRGNKRSQSAELSKSG